MVRAAPAAPTHTPVEEALLSAIRAHADDATAAHFAVTGLPQRRMEEWKYTDIRAAWRTPLPVAPQPEDAVMTAAQDLAPAPASPFMLTFVNGWLMAKEGVPLGVTIQPVQNDNVVTDWKDPALQLNASLTGATVMITVPAGMGLTTTLHLNYRMAGAPSCTFPRVHIQAGANSALDILETHVSAEAPYVLNGTLVITCGAGAQVTHTRVQTQGLNTLNIISTDVRLGEGAHYRAFALEEGAALSRNQYFVRQNGRNAKIELAGVTLAKSKQHLDTTLVVDHAVPGGTSRELFKQVLLEEATGVFQGKIIVQPHAQKTDGQMKARGLLLSESAVFNAKPELEIYADDVVCAHGATAGQLDEDLLFYLRARGLPLPAARRLLVSAFVGEALDTVPHDVVREALYTRVEQWLGKALS